MIKNYFYFDLFVLIIINQILTLLLNFRFSIYLKSPDDIILTGC